MRNVVYHVAVTLDGYIAHEDGSTDGFVPEGDHVAEYLDHLKDYDTVIMGKKTYEYGYQYGLEPGLPAYNHMMHYIFSETLKFDQLHDQVKVINNNAISVVNELKAASGTDIYLCGGGLFAGFLLDHQMIDEIKIKLNPVVFGTGIPLFGNSKLKVGMELKDAKIYESGVLLMAYTVTY